MKQEHNTKTYKSCENAAMRASGSADQGSSAVAFSSLSFYSFSSVSYLSISLSIIYSLVPLIIVVL